MSILGEACKALLVAELRMKCYSSCPYEIAWYNVKKCTDLLHISRPYCC